METAHGTDDSSANANDLAPASGGGSSSSSHGLASSGKGHRPSAVQLDPTLTLALTLYL